MRDLKIRVKTLSAIAICGICCALTAAWAGDGVQVTAMSVERTPAMPSGPYNINGYTIYYGVGENVRITDVTAGGNLLFRSAISKPEITINRIDNLNSSGQRLTMFYPGVRSGTVVSLEGDEAISMEQAMNDDYLTSGGLDVFLNVSSGSEQANNIERVDFVVAAGITLPTTPGLLFEVGTIANEKHGNNTYKIAMITAIDAFGVPTAYGPLRTIQGSVDYGNVGRPQDASGTFFSNVHMRNDYHPVGAGTNGPVAYNSVDTNFIGLSYISFGAMGAAAGQTVYGYSLFPSDMTDAHDLTGLSDAPLNTSGFANGGDIYGGTFAIFSTSAANAELVEGGTAELQGNKTVEVYDPAAAGLYALPGSDLIYSLNVSNTGNGSPDADSIFLTDQMPSDVEFYHGDIDDSGPYTDPIILVDSGSGLTLDYANDIGYSNSMMAPTSMSGCSYIPPAGYDPDVTYVCFQPSGSMAHGPSNPGFSLKFRARIK